MSETQLNMIDLTIGVVIVTCAAALFATPFALMLSSTFIVGS